MPEAANLYAPDGYQYGLRYHDGSIATPFTGSTQRRRAEEEAQDNRRCFPRDEISVVRRARGSSVWEPLERKTC